MRRHLRRVAVGIVGLAALVTGAMSGVQPAVAQETPNITVFPNDNLVAGSGWPEGTDVTLTIDDPTDGADIDYSDTAIAQPDPGERVFNVNFPVVGFDVQAGHVVTLSNGASTAVHTVTELTVTEVNPDSDTVSGTAEPYSSVTLDDIPDPDVQENHIRRVVQVPESGNWTANFSEPGGVPGEVPDNQLATSDLVDGSWGNAYQSDAENDGDLTMVNWQVQPPLPPSSPSLTPTPDTGLVDGQSVSLTGSGWPAGGTLYVHQCRFNPPFFETGAFDNCDLSTQQTYPVQPDGTVAGAFAAKSVLSTPGGQFDCAAFANACGLVGTVWPGEFGVGSPLASDLPGNNLLNFGPHPPPPSGPSFVVDPSSGLTDGQTVNVNGSGWIAGASLNIFECRSPVSQPNDCDSATQASVVTDGSGQFTTAYTVRQFVDPPNAPGTDCGPSFACVMLVQNPSTGAFSTQFLNFGVHTATVSGTVLNGAGGAPGPRLGALVCPGTSIPPGAPPPGCGVFFGDAQTGAYTTSGLSAGTYTIGGFGSAGSAILGAGTPVTLTLAAGEQVPGIDFVLGSRIEGHVTNPNGDPVENATVSLLGGPASTSGDLGVTTDATGYYQTPYLGAGTWTLEFHDPASSDFGRGTVTVGANATATLDVQIAPPASISGTVVGDSGPLVDTFVVACPDATTVTPTCPGLLLTSASSTGAGEFAFPSPFFAGSYAIVGFQGTAGAPLPVQQASPVLVIDVAPGDAVTCDFVLGASPSASCTGATGGDDDGVPRSVEDGAPNNGDGNNDGTPDSQQDNVTSLPNAVNGGYVSIASPEGTTLANVQAIDPATAGFPEPPAGAQLPVGVLSFQIQGVAEGATVPVEVFTPAGTNPNSYFKFHNDAWVDFTSNASFAGDVITLSLTDGQPGDADGQANGVIVDPGAPGFFTYDFTGFFAPVNNPPTLNSVKAGQAVPVKFSLGGDQGLDVFADGYPKSRQVNCDDNTPSDTIEETVSAGGSSLSYDPATGTYTYVWKTSKSWSDTCRQLVVRLADGTEHLANFEFR